MSNSATQFSSFLVVGKNLEMAKDERRLIYKIIGNETGQMRRRTAEMRDDDYAAFEKCYKVSAPGLGVPT